MWMLVARIAGGIFFGHRALRRISQSEGELKGLLLAKAGLSVCYIAAICLLFSLIYGAIHTARSQ